ncbi:SHOCT domain-containing protein [Gordonia sp. TBRC 11910]|uniref:SHOCT domain-containing protein n=1 Tax=Gordonia asplenii TaxID=2725283 RepID=A0A848KQY3_9ACTN|nr:SHOCT domain-containing protein [Gordonia asplenii]NMO01394.1 SHOCT domain-containing protein [Gordonia asplenii]
MAEVSGKIRERKAAKWSQKISPDLLPNEVIWAYFGTGRFKPVTEATMVTSSRVIGFTSFGASIDKRIVLNAWACDILSFRFPEKMGGFTLRISTPTGEVNFGLLDKSEIDFATYYLDQLRQRTPQPPVQGTIRGTPALPTSVPSAQRLPQASIPTVIAPAPAQDVQTGRPHQTAAGGIAGEIERLAELHRRGILDDDEFKQAKRAAIGSPALPVSDARPSTPEVSDRINLIKPS